MVPQARVTRCDRPMASTIRAVPISEGTYWPALAAKAAKSGSIQE